MSNDPATALAVISGPICIIQVLIITLRCVTLFINRWKVFALSVRQNFIIYSDINM